MDIEAALKNPYFDDIRNPNKEKISADPIILDFDDEIELSIDEMRKLFIKERNKMKDQNNS